MQHEVEGQTPLQDDSEQDPAHEQIARARRDVRNGKSRANLGKDKRVLGYERAACSVWMSLNFLLVWGVDNVDNV